MLLEGWDAYMLTAYVWKRAKFTIQRVEPVRLIMNIFLIFKMVMVINRFEIGVLTHLLHGLWVHLSLIKLYDSQYCITTSYLRDCFINKIRGRSTVAERFCCRTLVGGDKVHNVRKFVIDRHLVQIGHFILGNRNPR